jgi:hypothetical protein
MCGVAAVTKSSRPDEAASHVPAALGGFRLRPWMLDHAQTIVTRKRRRRKKRVCGGCSCRHAWCSDDRSARQELALLAMNAGRVCYICTDGYGFWTSISITTSRRSISMDFGDRRSGGGRDPCLVEHGPHDLHVLERARHHLAIELRRRRRLLKVAAVRRHDA